MKQTSAPCPQRARRGVYLDHYDAQVPVLSHPCGAIDRRECRRARRQPGCHRVTLSWSPCAGSRPGSMPHRRTGKRLCGDLDPYAQHVTPRASLPTRSTKSQMRATRRSARSRREAPAHRAGCCPRALRPSPHPPRPAGGRAHDRTGHGAHDRAEQQQRGASPARVPRRGQDRRVRRGRVERFPERALHDLTGHHPQREDVDWEGPPGTRVAPHHHGFRHLPRDTDRLGGPDA